MNATPLGSVRADRSRAGGARGDDFNAEHAAHAETFQEMLGELGDLRVKNRLCVLYLPPRPLPPSVGTRQGDHLARYRDADALLKHGQRLVLAHDKYRLQQLRRVVHRCK